MSRNKCFLALLLIASFILMTSAAFAGGPLLVDPKTKSAYHYDTTTPVPVYYDLGNLGVITNNNSSNSPVVFDNATGAQLVKTGYGAWSGIPTSSLRATVEGDFSLKGLPNITAANVTLVIGTSNGRGLYVIFDEDGSIMQNFFGAGDGVLGISSPQFSITDTTIITESFVVLNGSAIDPNDTNAANFQGVATHEFGHSLGMAHTQVNGAVFFYNQFTGESVGPESCGSNLPYATNLTGADVETMYPYINPNVGGTGLAQANLHTTDTLSSFSDLYPGPGWPKSYGTVTGKVYDLDGKSELTGVNVIARNLSDPFADSTSAITGQMTQGQIGPDGSYTIHGLKPGARYALYVDALTFGGFSTPPLWFLPGPERFWDGDKPTGYAPCNYTPIMAAGAKTTTANIRFAVMPGAPILHQLGYAAFVTGLDGDGTTAVGELYGRGGPVFQWTAKNGVVPMNVASPGGTVSISRNGRYISTNLLDVKSDRDLGAYRWDANNGWLQVATKGACGTDVNSSFAVSNDGSVFGFSYNTCTDYKAFRWNPNSLVGTVEYPSSFKHADGTWANSRIDQVSADGLIAVGWQTADWGGWLGTVWHNGKPELITDANGDPVSEAFTVSGDGSTIAGQLFTGQFPYDGSGWRRKTAGGNLEYFAGFQGVSYTNPYALSSDGSVMVGYSGNPFLDLVPTGPFLWTKQLGTVGLDDFVKHQGTAMEHWYSLNSPSAISDDGTTIAGTGLGLQFYGGWVLDMHRAFVCHASSSAKPHTISVAFPEAFDRHLADGDTPGRCP